MKKMAVTGFLLLFLLGSFSLPQNNDANEAYIKAMTTRDPNQKAQLLKDFLSKYGGTGNQYENFANAELCLMTYSGKTPAETIQHGERALALGGLDDLTKSRVLITVASMYIAQKQNLSKASSYASQVVQIARANKKAGSGAAPASTWNQLIGGGHYAQGQALEKSGNYRNAVKAYIESYNILKNPQIITDLKRLGKLLYDGKAYGDAEAALKIAAEKEKDFASLYLYAKCLHRNGKPDRALPLYKQAYMKQKSGEIAFNIGIILAKKAKMNPQFNDEALQYLLEASFLSRANSQRAMQMAESLYFIANKDLRYNEKVKELQQRSENLKRLTETFNQKFGNKEEEDLSEAEKKQMEKMLEQIEDEEAAIKRLQE
ncbi:MAG: hypothetical protein ACE5LV_05110 [Candidatus Aminicenantales bacterium]